MPVTFSFETAAIRCAFFPVKYRVKQLCIWSSLTSKVQVTTTQSMTGGFFGKASAVVTIQKLIIWSFSKNRMFLEKQKVFSQKTVSCTLSCTQKKTLQIVYLHCRLSLPNCLQKRKLTGKFVSFDHMCAHDVFITFYCASLCCTSQLTLCVLQL